MRDVSNLFLALVRAELRDVEPSSVRPDLSNEEILNSEVLDSLCRLASAHDMTQVLGSALFKLGLSRDDAHYSFFRRAQIDAVYRVEQLQYELARISELFEKCQIRHIPLKGSVLRAYYPRPEMRTSCDIDLLVDPADLDTAASALCDTLKYQKGKVGSHDVAFLSESGVSLELHYTLSEDKSHPKMQRVLSRVWDYALPEHEGACLCHLEWEFFVYYHIAHMVKHFEYGGCGIRTFTDLWVLRHRAPKFSDEKLERLLSDGEILTFAKYANMLSEMWFSSVHPNNAEDEALLSLMYDYLLRGGIYGSTENRVTVGRIKKSGSVAYIGSRLFLPYDNMKYDYPILQKHAILLPFCEVHRWFRLLHGGTARRIANELKINGALTEEETQSAENMFGRLGLK